MTFRVALKGYQSNAATEICSSNLETQKPFKSKATIEKQFLSRYRCPLIHFDLAYLWSSVAQRCPFSEAVNLCATNLDEQAEAFSVKNFTNRDQLAVIILFWMLCGGS